MQEEKPVWLEWREAGGASVVERTSLASFTTSAAQIARV